MIAKTFKGGLTYEGAVATINYLLNHRVEGGTAKLIFGDVEITKRLILEASKRFKWSWSSGVLSFSEILDVVTIRKIIMEHQRVFFAGLREDQFHISYVLHVDKGRTELHYIAPRIELSTGKSLNPYIVTRDFRKKDLFQDFINAEHGLSSPKAIIKHSPIPENRKSWAIKKTNSKEIDEIVNGLIQIGGISCRDDVIDFLRENGFELNEEGYTYLSVVHEKIKTFNGEFKPIKLKGDFYGRNFTNSEELERSIRQKAEEARRPVETIRAELDDIVRKQSIYNAKRYSVAKRSKPGFVNHVERSTKRAGFGSENRQGREREGEAEREDSDRAREEELFTKIKRRVDVERIRRAVARSRAQGRDRKKREAERQRSLREFSEIFDNEFNSRVPAVDERVLQVASRRANRIDTIFREHYRPTEEDYRDIKNATVQRQVGQQIENTIQAIGNRIGNIFGEAKQSIDRNVKRIVEILKPRFEDRFEGWTYVEIKNMSGKAIDDVPDNVYRWYLKREREKNEVNKTRIVQESEKNTHKKTVGGKINL